MRALRVMRDESEEKTGWEQLPGNLAEQQNQKARVMALVADGLPTLPGYVFQLNSLLNSTPVDLARVAEVIRADPSLSAQVIRLCNSSLSDPRNRATSIEDAVVILGTSRLRTLVLTCSLLEYVDHQSTSDAIQSFWQHSFLTAMLSERVAHWIGYPKPEQAYVAGLLHDIGLLPLLALAARERQPLPGHPPRAWGESVGKEREEFGTDHCSMGRWIGTYWNFPPEMVDVFEHHHDPIEAVHDPLLVGIVATVDRFCQTHGAGAEHGSPTEANEVGRRSHALGDYLPRLSPEERARLAELLETDHLHLTQVLELNTSRLMGGAPRAIPG